MIGLFQEGDKWLEILGCGMVHPNVLKNCKVNTSIYQEHIKIHPPNHAGLFVHHAIDARIRADTLIAIRVAVGMTRWVRPIHIQKIFATARMEY